MSECMQYPDILEKILIFLGYTDLYNLMQTCKTIRNIVGQSNAWTYIHEWMEFDGIFEYINIDTVVELFISIKISKKNFAIRPYYGKHYYLYTMKTWIAESNNDFWNMHSLINNQGDIKKLYKLSCHIDEPEYAKRYQEWMEIVKKLDEKLKEINHVDRDKILQMVYINNTFTDNQDIGYSSTRIYISNAKIKYNYDSKKRWYPFALYGTDPVDGNFCYRIQYDYDSENMTILKNGGNKNNIYPNIVCQKILELSKDIKVDFNTLFNILKILLGRCVPQHVNEIDRYMGHADNFESKFEIGLALDTYWESRFGGAEREFDNINGYVG